MGLEGIVSKRIGSRYVSGRTRACSLSWMPSPIGLFFRESTKLARSASLIGFESHQVIALRLSKLAQGGEAAQKEAHRMLAEKITAAQAAALKLAIGVSRIAVLWNSKNPGLVFPWKERKRRRSGWE